MNTDIFTSICEEKAIRASELALGRKEGINLYSRERKDPPRLVKPAGDCIQFWFIDTLKEKGDNNEYRHFYIDL